jgi:hypothetical protein
MFVYPSGVDVSSSTLRFLAAHLRRRRRAISSRWRRLSAGRQALLILVHLRMGHTYSQLAAGFGVGTTTAYRYVTEAADLLATLAPTLTDAVRAASKKAFVFLDGTLLPTDRIAADRPYYSGKHKKHGMNVQALTDPFGQLLWASPALPGAVHDIRGPRTRHHRRPRPGRRPVLGRQGLPRRRRNSPYPVLGTLGEPLLRPEGHGDPQELTTPAQSPVLHPRITSIIQAVPTLHLASSDR